MTSALAERLTDLRWEMQDEARSLETILAESGQRLSARQPDPVYLARLGEVAEFLADVREGRVSSHYLQEALSTSDFPILMGDILDRQMLGRYQEVAPTWPSYFKRGTVRDFRTVRRIQTDGLEGRYYPNYAKPELDEGLENNQLSETGYTYAVQVYEKRVAFNWRMLVNDDLDAFGDIPDRLARGARRTEEYFAATLFVDASGPLAALYSSGHKNIVNPTNAGALFTVTNPPLSVLGLQEGFAVLGNMVDADGEPIAVDMVTLVIPPSLEVLANNIIHATEIWTDGGLGGGASNQQVHTANWISRRLKVAVNPYIPIVASSANGSTSWFLFAEPSVSRPAGEIGFLRGYETPSLFRRLPNMARLGSMTGDPMMGDWETGEIRYKGLHIIGGTLLDYRATVASNGSSS